MHVVKSTVAEGEAGRTRSRTAGALSGADGDLEVSVVEAKELYCFLDGSIQNPYVRHQLWRSWGHCPRHTWAFAVANCELRLRPFQTGILYEDLTGRAARLLSRPLLPKAAARHLLRPHAPCFTCDYATLATPDPEYLAIAHRVNRRRVITEWLAELRPLWEPRSCPFCLGGSGLVCRPHLLSGRPWDLRRTAIGLAELEARLHVLVRSMTWNGPTATNEDRASVVEALGWFAGWLPAVAMETNPTVATGGSRRRPRPVLKRVQ